jgi:hypothetical protein
MNKTNPFDFLNAINQGDSNLLRDDPNISYPEYMVNRGMSLFADTIFIAYQADQLGSLDGAIKLDYYLHSVTKKKRFSKWPKVVADEDVDFVCDVYTVNKQVSREYIDMMGESWLSDLRVSHNKGGTK